MLYALIALCGILSFLSVRSSFFPLKWLTSFAWWGLLFYWIDADLVVDGEPTDVAIMGVIIMAAFMFLLWGFTGRRGTVDVESEYSSTGSLIRRITKATKTSPTERPSSGRESTLEYRDKVRKALHSGKTRRRR